MTSMTGAPAGAYARGAMVLAERWWTLVLRGVAAVSFGILAFIAPGASLFALVLLFGAYAIVNGVFDLVLAARSGSYTSHCLPSDRCDLPSGCAQRASSRELISETGAFQLG